MGKSGQLSKFSKKNRLLVTILLSSIAVVFAFLAILLYINYYIRVQVILTTIARYEDGTIKYVTEYDIINVKQGKTATTFPTPSVEGYSFGGWYMDDNCTEPYDYNLILNESIQVFGKLELLNYSIELVLDEGKKVAYNESQNFDYTEKFTIEDRLKLPLVNDDVLLTDDTEVNIREYKENFREGYTFMGWGFSSTATIPVDNIFQMTAQNLTFYAIWKPIQVDLRYMSMDLNFAERSPQSGFVATRIDPITGGVRYNSSYGVKESETLEYCTKIAPIKDPQDENKNFVFAGWYMDPNFTVPVKFEQLYIRNGYFSLTKEKNLNILEDTQSSMYTSEENREAIKNFASTDEQNSYIEIFAKWELKKYTVKYDLNLPTDDSYVDTIHMTDILNYGVDRYIYSDNGNNIRQNSNVYQGKVLRDTHYDSVLYDENYFKNVVYIVDDMTGLPLYTLSGWNSHSDGSGYDAQNSSDVYFDKSNFQVVGDDIIIYAQWRSYYRVNYYLTGVDNNTPILLSTENVEGKTITLPTLESLVDGINNREVKFTQKQIDINANNGINLEEISYKTPINNTFLGWTNESYYFPGHSLLYMNEKSYKIGAEVEWKYGIYLSSAVRNLYTAWLGNTNYFTYDLEYDDADPYNKNEKLDKYNFETINGQNLENSIFDIVDNGDGTTSRSYKYYEKAGSTVNLLSTVSNNEFLVKKNESGTLYSLYNWKLKDGTSINISNNQRIEFSESTILYRKFIENSEPYSYFDEKTGRIKHMYREIFTGIFIDGENKNANNGDIIFENETYLTRYSVDDCGAYIYIKANSVMLLTFLGDWVKNITLTYDAGVDDATWEGINKWDGTSNIGITNTAGGSLKMKLADSKGLVRPFYEFAGWSTINREKDGIKENYNKFIKDNTIYEKEQIIDLLKEDTTFYAVWIPVIYTVQVYKDDTNQKNNSVINRVYIAKEKFTSGRYNVTDEITLTGKLVTYIDGMGEEKKLTLTTSAIAGYGLSTWTNKDGVELYKEVGETDYILQVGDGDKNNLFNPFATDKTVNIYPTFSVLKYDVEFIIAGNGLNPQNVKIVYPSQSKLYVDEIYNRKVRELIPAINSNFYYDGYKNAGWLISGDVDSSGNVKDDYIIKDLYTSNLSIRSDLKITLIAEEITYPVKFVFRNPEGEAIDSISFEIKYNNKLTNDNINAIKESLNTHNHIGYNFSVWEVRTSGIIRYYTFDGIIDGLQTIKVTSSLTFYTKYEPAKVKVVYNYEVDGQNKQYESAEYDYLDTFTIEGNITPAPKKDGYILKGWTVEVGKENYFVAGDTVVISKEVFNNNIIKNASGKYVANLYAKWIKSTTLTFNTSGVTDIVGNPISLAGIVCEKGQQIYFKDIAGLTSLNLVRNDKWGEYTGIWIDQNGVEYDITNIDSSITLNMDITLTPKFIAREFLFNFYYQYNGEYISLLTQVVMENYTIKPILPSKADIDNRLSTIPALVNHRAIGYQLGVAPTDSTKIAIGLGQEFDFANNIDYKNKLTGKAFNFYIDLQELKTIIYYSDVNREHSRLVLDTTVIHTIGDYDNDGVVDDVPTKIGYEFVNWKDKNTNNQFEHGRYSAYVYAVPNELIPIWRVKDVKVRYYDDSTLLGEVDSTFDSSVNLGSFNSGIEGVDLDGWATTNGGNKQFNAGQIFVFEDNHSLLDADYVINLYAVWKTETHYVKVTTYNASGNEIVKYYDAGGNLNDTQININYGATINATLPSTASSYVKGGQTYEFTGNWTDGYNTYTSSINITSLKKNYEITPVYRTIYVLTFNDTNGNEIYKVSYTDVTFRFNNIDLVSATSTLNTTLIDSGSKIVGYEYNGTTYEVGSEDTIAVNRNMTFTAVVVEFATVIIYRNINADYTFANVTTISQFEIGSSIDLDDYSTTLTNSITEGFVSSFDSDYAYNKNVVTLSTGEITPNITKGTTLYLYPVIKTLVSYYINNVVDNNMAEYVRLGNTPINYTNELNNESEYMTGWRINSESGNVYNGEAIINSISLYTLAKPFLQIQVVETDGYISNGTNLMISKLKENDTFTLPAKSDVNLTSSDFDIAGWYLSYKGRYVQVNGENRVFALGESSTLSTILSMLGSNIDGTVYFEMTPIYIATITIFNSAKISYNYDVRVNNSLLSNAEKLIYENQFKSSNIFRLLFRSQLSATSDALSFVAYLVNASGEIITNNNVPISANITITKQIETGYSSDGWYYCTSAGVVTSKNVVSGQIVKNENIIAETAQANEVKATVTLQYYDGSNYYEIDGDSIYKDLAYLDNTGNYVNEYTLTAGQEIEFDVVVINGYEVVETGFTASGNTYTYKRAITTDVDITITIVKSTAFKPIINIDTSNISGYDVSKLNTGSIVYIEHDGNGGWERLYKSASDHTGEVSIGEFTNGAYQYSTSINKDANIKVGTNFVSSHYYVDKIIIYIDGASNEFDNNITTSVEMSGIPVIEIVLKDRTYQIDCYDNGIEVSTGTATKVTDNINIELPTLTKTNYTLKGYKISKGENRANISLVRYISSSEFTATNVFNFTLSNLMTSTSGRNQSNQKAYVLIEPVWVISQYTLSLTTDKGYYVVNSNNVNSISFNIDCGDTISFTKTQSDGVITNNNLSIVEKVYAIDNNGNIGVTSTTYNISFIPSGTWKFIDGYEYGTNQLLIDNLVVNTDISLTPKTQISTGEITLSVIDNVSDTNNKNLSIGAITYNSSNANIGYDTDGVLSELSYDFNTGDNIELIVDTTNGYQLSGFVISGNGKTLTINADLEEDALQQFITESNINLTYDFNNGKLNIIGLIYEISIQINVSRNNFSASIKVKEDASLESYFAQAGNLITVDGNGVGTSAHTISTQSLRKIKTHTLIANSNYFEIAKVSYIDNGNTYMVYGEGKNINTLSSYNSLDNTLTIVYGGASGNNLQFEVELRLKTFNIIFHDVSGNLYNASEVASGITTSEINYGTSITGLSLNAPSNPTYNGVAHNSLNLSFVGWTYYNGNYENGAVDNSKFESIDSLTEWVFNATNGNLHIFSNWEKLYSIKFSFVNDGYLSTPTLPSDISGLTQSSVVNLSVASRNGFVFAGYVFIANSVSYTMNYNGTMFTTLVSDIVDDEDITINSNSFTLNTILTTEMKSLSNTFKSIELIPIWTRQSVVLNVANDTNKGDIEIYSYAGGNYTLSATLFEIKTYNTIEAGSIVLDSKTYNCVYVKDNGVSIGAIVVKPKTANYYRFGKFEIGGNTLTNATIEGATTITVVYAGDYVPHTLNFAWDMSLSEFSYEIRNIGTNPVKIETYLDGELDEFSTINANATYYLTKNYESIIISGIRDTEVNVKIIFEGYSHNTSNEIDLEIEASANTLASSTSYVMKLSTIDVELSEYMYGANKLTTAEKYNLSYYVPVLTGGVITSYNLNRISVEEIDYKLTDVVIGSQIYIESDNEAYSVVDFVCGSSVAKSNSGLLYFDIPLNVSEYNVNIVFNNAYALVSFDIAGVNYASGYFATTNVTDYNSKPTANTQLVAFVDMLLNGYNSANNNEYTKIVKSISTSNGVGYGYNVTYYTASELSMLYPYEINENIAKLHYNDDLRNVWFENFNFESAYDRFDAEITSSDLFVGAGVSELTFVAVTSSANILTVNATLNSIDNAIACGGFEIGASGNYRILGDSEHTDTSRLTAYSKLSLKVKYGTTLSAISVVYDKHTYVDAGELNAFNAIFTSFSWDKLTANAGGEYEYSLNFYVKTVTIKLITSDDNNSVAYEFEKDYSSSSSVGTIIEMTATYATTKEDIFSEYSLSDTMSSTLKNQEEPFYDFEFDRLKIQGRVVNSIGEYLTSLTNYNNDAIVTLYVIYNIVTD